MNFIHKFVPSSKGQNDLTLLLLHGTGGNEEDLLPLGQFLAPEAAMLSVRGQVLEGIMPRFFRRLAEGVFDTEDLIFRTHELAQFVDDAIRTYSLNAKRMVAVGFSNGANIAASTLLLEPSVLSAAVLLRSMVPLELDQLPDLTGKRILMQSGRHDPIVPTSNPERLAQMFREAGAQVTLKLQNAGHSLVNSELVSVQKWLQQL